MQIIKKLFCSHFSVNKGLIQHVVQSCYNYNITFRKLEIHTVKMRPISACYTSGRGARHFLGIGRCTIASGSCSDVFVYGKSKYDVILHIPCPTKEENSDYRNYFRKQHLNACSMSQPTCWTRSRTAHRRAPKNSRAILPDKSNFPLDLSCVTIARRDFMIGLSSFYSLLIHTFDSLKFEIKTFIQPFANFIKAAHSRGTGARS